LNRKPQASQGTKRKLELKQHSAIDRNGGGRISRRIRDIITTKLRLIKFGEVGPHFLKVICKIIFDFQNFYNMCYLIISIIALTTHPLVYSILLLDIIKRSEDL